MTRPDQIKVSKEKAKEGPMEREKLNAMPWLVSVWQKARHLEAREESLSLMSVILAYF